ncbi:MAG: hypothetical protein AB2A00_00300 [Myxococcota bacterium]
MTQFEPSLSESSAPGTVVAMPAKRSTKARAGSKPPSATRRGRLEILYEKTQDDIRILAEGLTTVNARVDRLENRWDARFERIEAALLELSANLTQTRDELGDGIRKNTEEIRKNSEDIRKNSEDIRKNSEEIRKNSEDIRKNSEDIRKNSEDIRQMREELRGHSDEIRVLQQEVRDQGDRIDRKADAQRVDDLAQRVTELERQLRT